MTAEEIKATFLGQTVRKYDGWCGSNEEFVVTDVQLRLPDVVVLMGEKGNRNYVPRISFDACCTDELVRNGRLVSREEIDHCSFEVVIDILPTPKEVMERRVESIKDDIKRLKKELKQAQVDYNNYLVSSIRIDVIRKGCESCKS